MYTCASMDVRVPIRHIHNLVVGFMGFLKELFDELPEPPPSALGRLAYEWDQLKMNSKGNKVLQRSQIGLHYQAKMIAQC